MNMITVLLGATGLLLVVAVALSFGAMNSGTSEDDVEKLRQEIAALKASDQLAAQNSLMGAPSPMPPNPAYALPAPVVSPQVPPGASASEIGFPSTAIDPNSDVPDLGEVDTPENLEALIVAEELRLAEKLAEENDRLKTQNKILKNEIGIAWQPKIVSDTKNMVRAKTIQEAMLLARVTQWDEENGFAVIDILNPDAVQSGTTLAIRRQTGIYGQIKVGQLYDGGQAIADPDPKTFLGDEGIDVQPGDELILPPL